MVIECICIARQGHCGNPPILHRTTAGNQIRITALRGSGCYVGDVVAVERGRADGPSWAFTVRAVGNVKARFVPFEKFYELIANRPEIEADGRAGKCFLTFCSKASYRSLSLNARLW